VLPDGICIFKPKNSKLGKFWKIWQWTMLVFLWPFCLFYGRIVYLMAIWCIFGNWVYFPVLCSMLFWKKSGNPDWHPIFLSECADQLRMRRPCFTLRKSIRRLGTFPTFFSTNYSCNYPRLKNLLRSVPHNYNFFDVGGCQNFFCLKTCLNKKLSTISLSNFCREGTK
jgi:hypothetical protein